MQIIDHIEQRTPEWHRLRSGRPTASQFGRIITSNGERSKGWTDYALELVAESICPDHARFHGNAHTERGNELEPEARRQFERDLDLVGQGFELREVGFVANDDWTAGCSPDGLIFDGDGRPVAGVEIKCPMAKIHAGYLLAGELPTQYKAQVHGSMAITGLSAWYFYAHCPPMRPLIWRIDRDKYTNALAEQLREFCKFYSGVRNEYIPRLSAL